MEATEAGAGESVTYQCGICVEEFPEEGVVKYCDGKHVFCRECIDEWNKHSSIKTNNKTQSVEHYIHPGDYYRMSMINDLIYHFVGPVICPICRTTVDSIVHRTLPENYTGTYTKEISDHHGNYKIECSYLNGKKHGTYKRFLPDGRVQVECEFLNGRLEGSLMLYWLYKKQEDGKEVEILGKMWELNYVNGMRDGVSRDWTNIDTLCAEITYKAGIKHGETKTWYPNGNIQLIMTYDQGNIVHARQWRDSGVHQHEHNYDPSVKVLQPSWLPGEEQKVEVSSQHGIQKEWHSNGTLQSISHYNKGVKCGVHQEFDSAGNLVKEEDFGISEDAI